METTKIKCIIVNFSNGEPLVLPIDSPAAKDLALEAIVEATEYIEYIQYSYINMPVAAATEEKKNVS